MTEAGTMATRVARVLALVLMAVGRVSAQTPQSAPAAQVAHGTEGVAGTESVEVVDEAGEIQAASGGAAGAAPRTMTLELSLAGSDSNDATPTAAAGSGALSGYHSDAGAFLTFGTRGQRSSFALTARSVVRYDAADGQLSAMQAQGTLDYLVAGTRTQFHVGQNFTYTPSYQFGALPEVAGAPASPLAQSAQAHGDYSNAGVAAYGSITTIDVARALSRRSTLSFSYGLRHTAFAGAGAGFIAHAVGFRLTRQISRHASLRLGYGYQFGGSGETADGRAHAHNIDVGIDYGGALKVSKRTTVTFGTGSSVLTEGTGQAYRMSADASLTHLIGRTGHARLTYRRGVQVLEGFGGPVMFDAINAGFDETFRRRIAFTSSVGFSSGAVGSTGGGHGFDTITGAAGLRLPLTRRSALEAQYFYYQQRVGSLATLTPGLLGALNRQGIRVGVTWGRSLLH